MNDLVKTFYEVKELNNDDFLKLKETLTRMGVATNGEDKYKTLYQTAHVLQKKGKYYIVHFKQLFLLDGKNDKTNFTDLDKSRLAKIVALLEEWNLITVIGYPLDLNNDYDIDYIMRTPLTVIPFKNKDLWMLEPKYDIGQNHARG